MTLLQSSLSVSLAAMFATLSAASAAPFPVTAGVHVSQFQQIDYRRCYRRHGRRICRYYEDTDYDYGYDDYRGYGYGRIYFYGGRGPGSGDAGGYPPGGGVVVGGGPGPSGGGRR